MCGASFGYPLVFSRGFQRKPIPVLPVTTIVGNLRNHAKPRGKKPWLSTIVGTGSTGHFNFPPFCRNMVSVSAPSVLATGRASNEGRENESELGASPAKFREPGEVLSTCHSGVGERGLQAATT